MTESPQSAGQAAEATNAPSTDAVGTSDVDPGTQRSITGHGLACAVSGLTFAGLFIFALVLLHQAPALSVPDSAYNAFYRSGNGTVLVTLGLYIVPFAGIAFLWQMSTIRSMIESLPRPPQLHRWLHLASGVLFVAMLFAGTAADGAIALLTVFSSAPLPGASIARALASVGYAMVFVFGVRAAGVYMMATTTLMQKTGLVPRWLALLSSVAALFLLVSTTFHPSILLVFPGWMTVVSVLVLLRAVRPRSTTARPQELS